MVPWNSMGWHQCKQIENLPLEVCFKHIHLEANASNGTNKFAYHHSFKPNPNNISQKRFNETSSQAANIELFISHKKPHRKTQHFKRSLKIQCSLFISLIRHCMNITYLNFSTWAISTYGRWCIYKSFITDSVVNT